MTEFNQLPHNIINEDGKVWKHEGYIENMCSVCGRVYIVARNRNKEFKTCGRNDCDQQPLYT